MSGLDRPRATSLSTVISRAVIAASAASRACGRHGGQRPSAQVQEPAGDRRGEQGLAARDHADRADQFLRRRVLDEEAAGAGAQGVDDVLVEVERRHHQDPWRALRGQCREPPGGLDPVHDRHADIHDDDVRPEPLGQPHGLRAIGGLPDARSMSGSASRQVRSAARMSGWSSAISTPIVMS